MHAYAHASACADTDLVARVLRTMAGVLEEVRKFVASTSLTMWAGVEPGEGSRPIFDKKVFVEKMRIAKQYRGVAGNLLWLKLDEWAIPNQKLSRHEVVTYAKEFFDVPKALEQGTDGNCRGFQQDKPVVVAVTDATQAPAKGTMRKISMDKPIFAFLLTWKFWQKMPQTDHVKQTREKALALFRRQALHWPMDFVYFEPCPSLDQDIFKASFQIMEDTRREEEHFAPSGWQVCCLFAQARLMKKAESGDASAKGVEDLLKDINFAKSSDYKIKAGSKVVEQGLRVYDRFTDAGVEELVREGASVFGRGSPFDQLSKLVVVSQKIGDGSGKWEVGSGKQEVGNRKCRIRSGKWDLGSGK